MKKVTLLYIFALSLTSPNIVNCSYKGTIQCRKIHGTNKGDQHNLQKHTGASQIAKEKFEQASEHARNRQSSSPKNSSTIPTQQKRTIPGLSPQK
jgi:hypothetical protein